MKLHLRMGKRRRRSLHLHSNQLCCMDNKKTLRNKPFKQQHVLWPPLPSMQPMGRGVLPEKFWRG